MKISTLFRIAAVVALVQFIGHTSLFLTYKPMHGPDETAVVQAMQTHYFSFSGYVRSYWDMYFGYGLFSAFNCLIEALLLWFIAPFADSPARRILPVAATFLVANVGYTTLIARYFFALPGYFDVTLGLLMIAIIAIAFRQQPSRGLSSASHNVAM
jgi:uncharacterized membrane protein YhaH (DUF805 family)